MTARGRRVLGLFIIMFGLALYCVLVMKLAVTHSQVCAGLFLLLP